VSTAAEPPPPPPPPEPTPPPPPKVIRKSGGVLQGSALSRVEPSYPPLAKAAHVTGSVMVEITIDENGRVVSASALSGHPLLKDAAVQAARGWKFAPTMLSGVPVKVIGTITFNFQM
jgi:protein TonB